MAVFFNLLLKFVAPFLMGAGVAAAVSIGDTASISVVLGVASLWFFSAAMRTSRQPR